MTHSQQILIVSDEALSDFMRGGLEQHGFAVTTVHNCGGTYQQLHETSFDLVIVDLARAAEGVEFLRSVRVTPKLSRTLILTIAEWGTGQPTVALSEGADAYEPKPISAERLIAAVERLLRQEMVKTATATNGSGGIENDE